MMDELKQQFYEVMHKYQKPFSEEGVTANLTQWYEQKQELLQLLRRHPLWNEKELAIVFRVEERREIDRITVDETRAAILELGRRACTDDTVYENFETALRAATADYARIPNEYRLDTIRQYGGIKCAPGQKSSRIINRLCLKFHLDQIEEETEAGEPDNRYMRTVRPYNALFARLADALNPAHIEKTAVLSIHPCDFLEMSNRDNTWSSCHCLERGSYHGGCQSYMGDAVSMIFFTVSDEYTQDFHTAPRITREIFCYKDNVLLQSRLYPTDLEDQKTLYRSIVQQAIATCLDKPNLWSIKRGKDTEPYCESAADSNHYPDYEYGYAVVSLLKGETDYDKMTIGSVARCVCCGGEQKNHRSIRCTECGSIYNVLYISVTKDIRMYGQLKTLGTTERQMKKVVYHQVRVLSFWGILSGLTLSAATVFLIVPFGIRALAGDTIMDSAISPSYSPLIFIGAGLFSFITALISSMKPSKIASRVSPIEAPLIKCFAETRSQLRYGAVPGDWGPSTNKQFCRAKSQSVYHSALLASFVPWPLCVPQN